MSKYQYKVQGVDYDVDINEIDGNIAKVTVNGIDFEVEMKEPIGGARPQISRVKPTSKPAAPATPSAAAVSPVPAPAPAPAPAGAGTPTLAPLPGTITGVNVKVGDAVKKGDTVVVLEAMKMQNNIEAECDGTVTSVAVNVGDAVMEGATLVTIG